MTTNNRSVDVDICHSTVQLVIELINRTFCKQQQQQQQNSNCTNCDNTRKRNLWEVVGGDVDVIVVVDGDDANRRDCDKDGDSVNDC